MYKKIGLHWFMFMFMFYVIQVNEFNVIDGIDAYDFFYLTYICRFDCVDSVLPAFFCK